MQKPMSDRLPSRLKKYTQYYAGVQPACWLLIFLHGLDSLLISICYFLPLYFVQQLHFSVTTSGFTIAFYSLGTMVGSVMGGGTADRYSPRHIAVISLLAQGIAFFCLSTLHSPFTFMAALFFLGTATYSFITANFLWAFALCRTENPERLKVMNLMETASNLGLGLAAVIISVFLDHDLRLLAVFSSILLAGAAMLLLFFPPSLSSSPRARVSSHDSSLSSHASSMRMTLLTVFCSLFFVGLIISQLGSTYSLFVHHAFPHYHLGGFGWLFALNTFLVVLLQTPLACHLRRYPPVLIMGAGAFLLGSGMFTLIFALHFSLVILACLLYTTGEMLFFSVAQLICYEQAPADKKGLVLGGYRLVYAVSRILGPAAGSYLYEAFGAACLWFVCGLIGTVCLAVAVIYHYCIEELIPMQPLTNGASAANRAPE